VGFLGPGVSGVGGGGKWTYKREKVKKNEWEDCFGWEE